MDQQGICPKRQPADDKSWIEGEVLPTELESSSNCLMASMVPLIPWITGTYE